MNITSSMDRRSIGYIANHFNQSNTLRIDTAKFQENYERADYEKIVNDSEMFLTAYCKALPAKTNEDQLRISHFFNETVLQGDNNLKMIVEAIERLRSFFIRGFASQKSFDVYLIDEFNDNCYFKEPSEKFDCTKNQSERISKANYNSYIKPIFSKFAANCGALYSENDKIISVKTMKHSFQKQKINVLEFKWDAGSFLSYKISPRKINDLTVDQVADILDLYHDYLEEQNCDYQIITENKIAIKVHCYIIQRKAKKFYNNLLSLKRIDFGKKSISLSEFSETTVRAFLDFIYLNVPLYQKKMIWEEYTVDKTLKLLKFAIHHEIPNLVDCCTNHLSRIANKEDAESISLAAETNGNEHLKKLCQALKS